MSLETSHGRRHRKHQRRRQHVSTATTHTVLAVVLVGVVACEAIHKHATSQHEGWYSQAGQDKLVVEAFASATGAESITSKSHRSAPAQPRYFIDLAANDPLKLSNSLALEERGWRGVCIDALGLMEERFSRSNRTCTFVRALVGRGDEGSVLFRELLPRNGSSPKVGWVHTLSSIVANEHVPTCWDSHYCLSLMKLDAMGIEVRHTRMRIRSLSDILQSVGAPTVIDYLSLDVEGHETDVLRGLDDPRDVRAEQAADGSRRAVRTYKLRVVTIERPIEEARQRLSARGLLQCRARLNGIDEMYVDGKHARCELATPPAESAGNWTSHVRPHGLHHSL